jgi:CrcB protein
MLVALLIIGGSLGAPARYLLDGFVQSRTRALFPWGTYAVNMSGSLLLGFLTGLALYHGLGPLPRIALGTGFCGAYTTFSTFTYETIRLVEEGSLVAAMTNVALSIGVGLLAAAAGLALAAAW